MRPCLLKRAKLSVNTAAVMRDGETGRLAVSVDRVWGRPFRARIERSTEEFLSPRPETSSSIPRCTDGGVAEPRDRPSVREMTGCGFFDFTSTPAR